MGDILMGSVVISPLVYSGVSPMFMGVSLGGCRSLVLLVGQLLGCVWLGMILLVVQVLLLMGPSPHLGLIFSPMFMGVSLGGCRSLVLLVGQLLGCVWLGMILLVVQVLLLMGPSPHLGLIFSPKQTLKYLLVPCHFLLSWP